MASILLHVFNDAFVEELIVVSPQSIGHVANPILYNEFPGRELPIKATPVWWGGKLGKLCQGWSGWGNNLEAIPH